MKDIRIIEVNSEIGAGTRGSSLGIPALKIVCVEHHSDFFKKYKITEVQSNNHLLYERNRSPYAKRIEGILEMVKRIADTVQTTYKNQEFPIILSGDHSNAAGTVAGIHRAFPGERLGVIWVDAHADIHSPYTTPSGNIHGMPVAVFLAIDNIKYKINDLQPEIVTQWEELKTFCCPVQAVRSEDMIYISARNNEPAEDYIIASKNIKCFSAREVRNKGSIKVAHEAITQLLPCDRIYVSFDVDSLDSSISKGTGTPVPNGLFINEVQELLKTLVLNTKVCCFEMVEINPLLDTNNLMAKNVFPILQEVTEAIDQRLED